MNGYQLTFFTQQDRLHRDSQQPLAQWLLTTAYQLGIHGATLVGALQGIGHDGTTHEINMFDMGDQPVQITLVVTPEESQRLFSYLKQENVYLFYVKVPAEFGTIGSVDT